jgi:hypothetical protein
MTTASVATENRRDDRSVPATAAGCSGTCTYTLEDGQWVLTKNTCSGGGSCAQCKGSYNPDIAALLLGAEPDASTLRVSCAQVAMTEQILGPGIYYKKQSIGLAVCLGVSLIVNAYMLFFR